MPRLNGHLNVQSQSPTRLLLTGANYPFPLSILPSRPAVPEEGMFFFNTTTQTFDGYRSGEWVSFSTGDTGVDLTPRVVALEDVVAELGTAAMTDAEDYDAVGTASTAVSAHEAASDPHSAYSLNRGFDVRRYGTFGVGTDALVIQAAIDAAHAAGGGIVYLPAGTYRIDRSLTIYGNIGLVGDGIGATVIETANQGDNTDDAFTGDYMIDGGVATDADFFFMRDLELKGASIYSGRVGGVRLDAASDCLNPVFLNIFIHDMTGDGYRMNIPVAGAWVNCRVQDVGGNAWRVTTCIACTWSACYANGAIYSGYLLLGPRYSTLSGCAADSCSVAYNISNPRGVTLNGCGAEATTYRAVYMPDTPGVAYQFSLSTGQESVAMNGCYSRGFIFQGSKQGSSRHLKTNGTYKGLTLSGCNFRSDSADDAPEQSYETGTVYDLGTVVDDFGTPPVSGTWLSMEDLQSQIDDKQPILGTTLTFVDDQIIPQDGATILHDDVRIYGDIFLVTQSSEADYTRSYWRLQNQDDTIIFGQRIGGWGFSSANGKRIEFDDGIHVQEYAQAAEYRSLSGDTLLHSRGAAIADATDSSNAVTQLNALLAYLRDQGMIEPGGELPSGSGGSWAVNVTAGFLVNVVDIMTGIDGE